MADARDDKPGRHYRYYDLIMAGFVAVLLCSDLIGPGKVCEVAGVKFGAGNLFFPIGYIFGDILTEVYGFARARKVVWAGFGALAFATVMGQFVIHAPLADPDGQYARTTQGALETVFGGTWRVMIGSMLAYWVGDFVNCYVLAKLKLATNGKHLWTRTIGSTIAAQLVDSAIFYPIAFAGAMPNIAEVVVFNWLFKVGVEIVMTPVTYAVVGALKRAERVDYFDRETNFTPFSLRD